MNMNENEPCGELKPCPWCGNPALGRTAETRRNRFMTATCSNIECHQHGQLLSVRTWNTRAAENAAQWTAVTGPDDLPKELGWYLVSIRETSELGVSCYTAIVSFYHSAEAGLTWHVDPNERVMAWRPRPTPYTAAIEEDKTEAQGGGE